MDEKIRLQLLIDADGQGAGCPPLVVNAKRRE